MKCETYYDVMNQIHKVPKENKTLVLEHMVAGFEQDYHILEMILGKGTDTLLNLGGVIIQLKNEITRRKN